jgi:hypothetical protein
MFRLEDIPFAVDGLPCDAGRSSPKQAADDVAK